MNSASIYHVSPIGHGWVVGTEEEAHTASAYADKSAAIRYGQALAHKARGSLVVHRDDGSIQAEHRY